MKISYNNKISFEKKLVANCCVKNGLLNERCGIFKLSKQEDSGYFSKLYSNKDWKNSNFLGMIDSELTHGYMPSEIYSLENKRGKCLGFCQVYSENDTQDELFLIETIPIENADNKARKRKYIGETMLAFLVKRTFEKGKKNFLVDFPTLNAIFFYRDKCGFKYLKSANRFGVGASEAKKFLEQNEKHTNSTIEIMG